ncbi:hypothetical protein PGT21_008573 [Puccinia graminis f. sp. tritici]|uniref:Uncharacterized protein n=1 Tax=Puccinia graminis f. sp. tritici TaxID=56615 RepID=A0A5B0NK51_PUCGR|nr:hypothetical protein PGT21_008573 [Puccinia graminis f. sp. tritici]KAA1128823.1 hypothetical protein PGTUg99_024300 [Puccinia graminis f. sp. tritici]
MSLCPKSQRLPPQKASDVPSPGRYNPLLHDPSQDPCRKDPLEIYKAPRNKESDPDPDTFGLYNSDQEHYDNIRGSRPRSRALSTPATPSKHHKELLRLETKLSEYESNITHLRETLQKSEQTTKEIRNALNKSENDYESLRSEVSRLKKQLHGAAGLHAQVIAPETEHDKGKKRRENDISNFKTELRSAETRASQSSKRNQSRMSQKDEFRLLTSFVLPAKVLQSSDSDVRSLGLPTLDLHLARLSIGHQAIAQAIPESWCAKESAIDPEQIVKALNSTIQSHREQSPASLNSLRVRLTVGPSQAVSLVTSTMPAIALTKLLVSIDDRPTTYEGEPFLLTKTTYRSHYDHTRSRHGAKYEPKEGELFDVLMFNNSRQVTETTISNIAIRRKKQLSCLDDGNSSSDPWITPHLSCGLLNGVRRQFLLGQGEITEGIIMVDDLINQGLETWEMICFNEVRGLYHVNLIDLNGNLQDGSHQAS